MPAFACSVFCEGPPTGELVVPASGAEGVPTDAAVVVTSGFVALVGDDGEEVAVEQEALGELLRVVPLAPLSPSSSWTVVLDVNGTLVEHRFTTGTGPGSDQAVPSVGSLEVVGEVHHDLRPGSGIGAGCGGLGEGVWLDLSWPATTGLYEVTAVTKDAGEVVLFVAGEAAAVGWTVPCLSTLPNLKAGEEVALAVRSVDELGRRSDPVTQTTTAARAESGCSVAPGSASALAVLAALALTRRTSRSTGDPRLAHPGR